MTLYELSEKYVEFLNQCDDSDTDIVDALNSIETDIEEKVRNGIGLLQTLKRRAESYNAEIARLTRLKKATESNIERIQNYYLDNLRYLGKKTVATSIGAMTVAKSGGKRPLILENENLVPAEYKIAKYEIDKETLRADLEQGAVIEGAHLGERSNYLRIT